MTNKNAIEIIDNILFNKRKKHRLEPDLQPKCGAKIDEVEDETQNN